MKKIFLGVLALTLMTSTTVLANGGKKKSKKAKSCATKCTDKKDCKVTPTCTPMPGCCKM